MLPATVFCLALICVCTTSPVYNMQPAFITTNIGNGRNIRNLPCISRKSNESGVCMFAIDCLKSNGTHLGTCIDRFYFGSCCRIEADFSDNSIDTNIIPAREPPLRLSSTIRPTTDDSSRFDSTKNATQTTAGLSTAASSTVSSTTQKKVTTTTPRVTTQTVATAEKVATTQKVVPSSTTEKMTTSVKVPTTQKVTTVKNVTTESPTTVSYKLSTFQSVNGNVEATTKAPLNSTTQRVSEKPTTTKKPIVLSTVSPPKPSSTTSSTTKSPSTTKLPSTTSTTSKPTLTTHGTNGTTPPATKPISSTTKKPVQTSKPTKKPTQTKLTTPTGNGTTSGTKQTTTKKPVSISSSSTSTTLPTTTTSTPMVATATGAAPSSTEPSSGQAAIVTWTMAGEQRNASTATPPIANSTNSEEWGVLTTSDNWVPLPSVGTSPPPPPAAPAAPAPTTDSAGAPPSVTYIPLEPAGAPNATEKPPEAATPAAGLGVDAEIRPVNMSDFTDVCGRRMYPEARIVGGEKSSFGKWPWQISLRQWRTSTYLHKCGAALLNENWAITAAHCVDNVPPSDLLLRLGEHDLSTESEPYLHQERRVQIVASHPNFDPRTFEYDLALLRFYEPVNFQPNILPVCIPQADENFVGRTAHVTGWGRLYEDGPLPSVLQEVSVPVINNSVCESMYRLAGYIEHIPHIFICAGWRRGGFDSCEGDSGGPMVIQREDRRFLLAGVISWGIGCAEPNQPGVYTRISEFKDWINQILQF